MSEIQMPKYGALALAYCNMRLPLQVCRSAAGYYIGTTTKEGEPVTRESVQYFGTESAAEDALRTGEWTQKANP